MLYTCISGEYNGDMMICILFTVSLEHLLTVLELSGEAKERVTGCRTEAP